MRTLPLLLASCFIFSISLWGQTPMLLKHFNPTGSGEPNNYIEHGGFLYFTARDGNTHSIYRTDGNINNTIAITSNIFSFIEEFEIIGNQAFFTAYDPSFNLELYNHSLTPNTLATKITINNTQQSDVTNIVYKNGRLYFNANSNSDGYQICSIDISTFALHVHTLPPPFNTSQVNLSRNRAYKITGEKSLVELNGKLIFQEYIHLFSLDLSIATATPVLIGNTGSHIPYSPYVFNGKVYLNGDNDLLSSDGTTLTTELADVGPYYFMEFQNHLYFSGVPSSNTTTYSNVLYSIDVSGAIQEFPTIPTFGGTLVFNRFEEDYALIVIQGELHTFINPFPNATPSYGIYKLDVSSPSAPVLSLVLDEKPKEMFNIEYIFGHYYYWYIPFNSFAHQFKKKNLINDIVVASSISDVPFKYFYYWQDDLYFTSSLQINEFSTCENLPSNYISGGGWFKLSESQLDCQSNRVINPSFFLKDNIFSAQTLLTLDDPIILNSNSCHILSVPNFIINDVLQVSNPAILVTNNHGCQ